MDEIGLSTFSLSRLTKRQSVCTVKAESDISGNEQHPLKLYHHILLSLSHFDTTLNPGIGAKTGFLELLDFNFRATQRNASTFPMQ